MSELPTTENLEDAKKFPWQWAVIVLMGVVASIFGFFMLRVNKGDETCDARINNIMKANARKDSTIADWQNKYINLSNELLYKNNIIDRQKMVIDQTDSLTRKKLEKPAKQIVKGNE